MNVAGEPAIPRLSLVSEWPLREASRRDSFSWTCRAEYLHDLGGVSTGEMAVGRSMNTQLSVTKPSVWADLASVVVPLVLFAVAVFLGLRMGALSQLCAMTAMMSATTAPITAQIPNPFTTPQAIAVTS